MDQLSMLLQSDLYLKVMWIGSVALFIVAFIYALILYVNHAQTRLRSLRGGRNLSQLIEYALVKPALRADEPHESEPRRLRITRTKTQATIRWSTIRPTIQYLYYRAARTNSPWQIAYDVKELVPVIHHHVILTGIRKTLYIFEIHHGSKRYKEWKGKSMVIGGE